MQLKKVSLFAFKNYSEATLEFSSGVNCFVGHNGGGKTNILDAIHYLSMTKSAINSIDSQSILHGERLATINGDILLDGQDYQVICALQQGQKKIIKVNQSEYDKLSEHIGRFPVVLIAPNDTDIIRDSSEVRRKFFDSILSQLDRHYLGQLIQYNHYLKQRNSLLKQLSSGQQSDYDLLAPYDHHLVKVGSQIHLSRKKFVDEYLPILIGHYQNLSEGKEAINLTYSSQLSEADFESNYKDALQKDLILQRTNFGIHKDQYLFEIDDLPIKKFGSQGQQKSFLIALKLAHFDIIKNEKGVKPLLLLDDIFDKLDDFRIQKLVEMVAKDNFGQLFITDARPERSKEILQNITSEIKFFMVNDGNISAS
jgi:DNA replication and repair protein RecF